MESSLPVIAGGDEVDDVYNVPGCESDSDTASRDSVEDSHSGLDLKSGAPKRPAAAPPKEASPKKASPKKDPPKKPPPKRTPPDKAPPKKTPPKKTPPKKVPPKNVPPKKVPPKRPPPPHIPPVLPPRTTSRHGSSSSLSAQPPKLPPRHPSNELKTSRSTSQNPFADQMEEPIKSATTNPFGGALVSGNAGAAVSTSDACSAAATRAHGANEDGREPAAGANSATKERGKPRDGVHPTENCGSEEQSSRVTEPVGEKSIEEVEGKDPVLRPQSTVGVGRECTVAARRDAVGGPEKAEREPESEQDEKGEKPTEMSSQDGKGAVVLEQTGAVEATGSKSGDPELENNTADNEQEGQPAANRTNRIKEEPSPSATGNADKLVTPGSESLEKSDSGFVLVGCDKKVADGVESGRLENVGMVEVESGSVRDSESRTAVGTAASDASSSVAGRVSSAKIVVAESSESVQSRSEAVFDNDFKPLRDVVAMNNETEDAYFAEQKRQLAEILRRMDTAIKTAGEFSAYMKRSLKLLEHSMGALNFSDPDAEKKRSRRRSSILGGRGRHEETAEWPAKFGKGESGTMQTACFATISVNQRLINNGMGLSFALKKTLLPKIEKEIASLQATRGELEATAKEIFKRVDDARAQLQRAWDRYEECKRLKRSSVPYPAKNPKQQQAVNAQDRDGMMAYMNYQVALSKSQAVNGEYATYLVAQLDKFCLADKKRARRLQKLMVQFSQAQINYHQSCAKVYQSSVVMAEGIDAQNDHVSFCDGARVGIPKWQAQGDGKRSGDLEGALDLMPPVRDKETIGRIDGLEISKTGVLTYRIKNALSTTWKPVYCLLSGRGALHLFHRKGDEKPYMTLGLRFSTINLAPSVHPNAFRIMELQPGLLGEKRVKHMFRTGKQETMAEWMVALKQYLPSGTIELTKREMAKFERKRRAFKRRHGHTKNMSSMMT